MTTQNRTRRDNPCLVAEGLQRFRPQERTAAQQGTKEQGCAQKWVAIRNYNKVTNTKSYTQKQVKDFLKR
jgi:hypothetical protein